MSDQLFHYLAALVGAAGFAVVFRTPRRYFFHTVIIGFCSATSSGLFPKTLHVGLSTFFTALGIACMSHVFARLTRAPAQCFLIPGVIFLVPGTYIYRAFSAALEQKMDAAVNLGLAAVTITVGISFGLLLANWAVPARKTL